MQNRIRELLLENIFAMREDSLQASGWRSGNLRKPQMGMSWGSSVTAAARLDNCPIFNQSMLGSRAISQNNTISTQGIPALLRLPINSGNQPSSTPRMMELQ